MVEYGGDVNSGNVPGQRGHACEGCWCIGRRHQHDFIRWEGVG